LYPFLALERYCSSSLKLFSFVRLPHFELGEQGDQGLDVIQVWGKYLKKYLRGYKGKLEIVALSFKKYQILK